MSIDGGIREKMVVVSSDGENLGTVDRVEGDRIKLATTGPAASGGGTYVAVEQVELVEDDEVHLLTSAKAALQDAATKAT
jgi:hypothetical protein